MALRTPPSWLQNGSHPAENDRLTTQAIWKTTGLVNSTDLQITQNGGGNMSVNVSSGYCAIVGTTQSNMGTYMAYNDASTNLVITTASGSNPRIDLIVVTISDAYYTGTLNTVAFQVIAGTPAVSPTVPATPANSLALGQIAVGTSVTSILTANITNYGTLATSPFQGSVTLTNAVTLTNKSLSDSTTFFVDVTDGTKKLNIDVTGTTGITGTLTSAFTTAKTLTLPDATDTLVGKATTDTLTNKTLTAPIVTLSVNTQTGTTFTPALSDAGSIVTLNNAAAIAVTIPTNASVAYAIGSQLNFVWITGAGQPTISAVTPGTTTIVSTGATAASPKLRAVNSVASCIKIATDTWIVMGDIA